MNTRPPIIPVFLIGLFLFLALFGPMIAPYDPNVGELSRQFLEPLARDVDGGIHFFGTDQYGRDIFSRVLCGARVSIVVALISIGIAGAVGSTIGLVSGYVGGRVDSFFMRLADITLSIPVFLIAIVLAVVSGPSETNVVIAVAFLLWPRFARQLRGEALALAQREFVDYARAVRIRPELIIWRHILPNVVPTLVVLTTWQAGYVIILESSLSFLGAGVPPPAPAWGLMIAEGNRYLTTSWWLPVFPCIAIVALVLSVNLLGDWLRDRLDPMLATV